MKHHPSPRRRGAKSVPSVTLRIPARLYERMRTDLERPHPFAAERVGFLFVRTGDMTPPNRLLLAHEYCPVSDDEYIDDPKSGARIGSGAIRGTMQRILDGTGGAFHVHMHDHSGQPGYSRMDSSEQPKLIVGFQTVADAVPHGTLVLSHDHGIGTAWLPERAQPVKLAMISVVGAPMRQWERTPR